MNVSMWVRQTHRWLSIIFATAVVANTVTVLAKQYNAWLGLSALLPLVALMLTGLYLFALPYATKLRSGQRNDAL